MSPALGFRYIPVLNVIDLMRRSQSTFRTQRSGTSNPFLRFLSFSYFITGLCLVRQTELLIRPDSVVGLVIGPDLNPQSVFGRSF